MTIKNLYIKRISLFLVMSMASFTSCVKEDFSDAYADPSSVSVSSVPRQFVGFITANHDYTVPSYWNYFVVLRPTVNIYTQAIGWVNAPQQYVPGAGLISDRWNNYYNFLFQYRELEMINAKLTKEEQDLNHIFMIAAKIFLYDHTQKVVDLHGDIPFSEAAKLNQLGGNYNASYPKYDKAEDIYTKMLDDLKNLADELSTYTIPSDVKNKFTTQDIVNNGSLDLWKKYCNSLRLRLLMRVSDVPAFKTRATSEISAILADQTKYPVVQTNADNIQIDVFSVENNHDININSTGFKSGLEDWNGNLAGKAMIDQMNATQDPRLRVMFEPGAKAGGVYTGLDPLMVSADQNSLVNGGLISIYNRSTLSRNQSFPGVLINAAEINFLIAEFQLKAGNDGAAETAYNNGIEQSIQEYFYFRTLSNDNTAGVLTPLGTNDITNYQNQAAVAWGNAASDAEKEELIAIQKWLHFSVLEPLEGWSEQRRMNLPVFQFQPDQSNAQSLPPNRWVYAPSENTYNTVNYSEVKAKDNLTNKIFWDID